MNINTIVTYLLLFGFYFGMAQKEKTYTTKKVFSPIRIDGKIDENSWERVHWEGDFVQTEPKNGGKPTFDTQFKILYDQQNLYVAIRAFDKQPDSIVVSNKPRDFFDGDYVEINIDSDFDGKDAFSFTITAGGIRGDEHIRTSGNWFNDWNPNWSAETKIDKQGWTAELKIPLSELDVYSKKESWGIQVNRSLERYDEGSSWTSVPDEDKWVEYFGVLKGIDNMPISKRISLTDKIKPSLLKKDFSDLYNSLQLSYPSLYRYRSLDFINYNYNQTLKALEKEMTLVEFFKTVSSFISKIGDGHMKVELPDYFAKTYSNKLKKLPFSIIVTDNGTFVSENFSKNILLNHAQITSINGVSIVKLIHEIAELIPSDGYNLTGKYHKIPDNFDFYASLIFGFKRTLEVDYIPEGQKRTYSTNFQLLTGTEIDNFKADKKTPLNYESFNYQTKGDVAVLTIRTFNDAEGFKGFVDESFKKIRESKIDKVILDFRGNGGGEETNAIYLYSYLTSKPFFYYDRYEVGIEPNKKVGQESTLISYETLNFFSGITSKDDMDRNIITNIKALEGRFIDPTEPQQPKTYNNFDGQVVVLMDGGSFSATSEICAIMARDHRATLMGTETGGGFDGNTSGIYDQINLPNSRLKVKIPLVKYVIAAGNAKFVFARGVQPNYTITEFQRGQLNAANDQLMDFGIEYLKREKSE